MNRADLSGCVIIDKPEGITSFQTLGFLKKALSSGKIGHTGTLDRFASGVLVVFAGAYTRLVPYFSSGNKIYEATFEFGKTTATLDPEGETVGEAKVPAQSAVLEAMKGFRGPILQKPPDYSAVHVNGKRAYERVLSGETVDLQPRPVFMRSFEMTGWNPPFASFRIECSKGTYVRSLARDLAEASGSAAYVRTLRRTRNDPFDETDAVLPEKFVLERDLRPVDESLALRVGISCCRLNDSALHDFACGKPIRESWFGTVPQSGISFVFACGYLSGIVSRNSGGLQYEGVFHVPA